MTFKQFVIQPEDTGEWLALLCEGVGKTRGGREGSVETELKSKQGREKWPSRRRERHKGELESEPLQVEGGGRSKGRRPSGSPEGL